MFRITSAQSKRMESAGNISRSAKPVPDHQMAAAGIADGCVSHSHEAFTSDDLVPQAQFATPEPIQIVNQNVQHIVLVLPRFSGGMRRDQHIAKAPER